MSEGSQGLTLTNLRS